MPRQSALKEARAHQKLRAADLTFDALVTYCTLPVQDEQGMQVETQWPFLLPHTMAGASIIKPFLFTVPAAS